MASTSSSTTTSEGKTTTESPVETPPIAKLSTSYPIIPRSELKVFEQLGSGTFGSVFRGLWTPSQVANGVVKDGSNSPSAVVALKKVFMLEKEVDILAQVRHRNIIQFFGVSHANPDFYIVTEYAENGSLYEYLHNAATEMPCELILRWAAQIAHGIAYLHYDAPVTIIHRDLKSKNVVIGNKNECKLCDFGTSKDLTHSFTAPTWGGTAAWMSPEIISQKEGITTSTDVWSFGVLLWEMFTREIPYLGLTEFKIYSIISQHGVKLVVPDTCPEHLANLLRDCWTTNPKDRIDMKQVVACLEHIREDKKVRRECAHFVEKKYEWGCKIKEQITELDAVKLDLARQMEELTRREQALRRRENSHRNFLATIDYVGFDNVAEWNQDCVCEWVQKIAANAGVDDVLTDTVIDRMIASVLQHDINGARLLQITEKDLENLGMESPSVRRFFCHRIDELRLRNQAMQYSGGEEFPTLQMSAMMLGQPQGQGAAPIPKQFNYTIVLHVGLYSREVFLDSDWESNLTDSVPPEIHDSSSLIRDVCFSMVGADKKVALLETVRCFCPPFGYLEWVEVDESTLPVNLVCAVTYTDQVMSPRNTRINLEIDDAKVSRSLCNKAISLKIRPVVTPASLTRISSFHHFLPHSESPEHAIPALQGVWRRRGSSFGNDSTQLLRDRKMAVNKNSPQLLTSSQTLLWAEIASPKSSIIAPNHSMSMGGPAPSALNLPIPEHPLPKRAISYASPSIRSTDGPTLYSHSLRSARTKAASPRLYPPKNFLYIPNGDGKIPSTHRKFHARVGTKRNVRRRSETDAHSEENGEQSRESGKHEPEHCRFFVEPDSPEGDSADQSQKQPEPTTIREVPNRCCAGSCRLREKSRITPPQEEETTKEDEERELGEIDDLQPIGVPQRRKSKRSSVKDGKRPHEPTIYEKAMDAEEDDKESPTNDLATPLKDGAAGANHSGRASCKIYGGYNKWKWKG